MQITAQSLTGSVHTLDVSTSTLIDQVKSMIELQDGPRAEDMKLILTKQGRKDLPGNESLGSLGISDGDKLMIINIPGKWIGAMDRNLVGAIRAFANLGLLVDSRSLQHR